MKSVPIWNYSGPHFSCIFPRLDHIQSECGKMRTRITSNTDSFYAVFVVKYYLIWLLIAVVSKCNTTLKQCNTKLVYNALEVNLLLSSTVCTLCSLVSKQTFAQIFSVSNNCRKKGNMRTGTKIVSPCII